MLEARLAELEAELSSKTQSLGDQVCMHSYTLDGHLALTLRNRGEFGLCRGHEFRFYVLVENLVKQLACL